MQSNLLHIHADWLPLSHPCPLCWSKQHQPLTCWYHLCHNGKAAWCPKSLSPGFSRPPLIWAVADPWPCLALVFIATDRGLWQWHIFVIIVARMITVIGSLFSVNQKRSVGYDLALNLNQMVDSNLPNSIIENCYIFPTKKKKKRISKVFIPVRGCNIVNLSYSHRSVLFSGHIWWVSTPQQYDETWTAGQTILLSLAIISVICPTFPPLSRVR